MAVSLRSSLASSRWWVLAAPAVLAVSGLACSIDAGDEPNNSSAGAAGSGSAQAGSGSTSAGTGTVLPGGGASATAGTGNVTAGTTSTGGTTATGGTASTGGSAPTAGTTSTGGGNSVGMDTPPVRPLNINMAAAANKQITFTAKQLDPMAGTSTPDTNATAQEHGFVDTRKPKIQGKLVMTLGGIGTCCGQGGIGGFAVGLGFHEMAIAMQTKESSAPDEYKKVPEASRTDEQNRQMGDARMEAWDGKDRVSWLNINEHDSFAYRAALGIKYMQEQDPGGDWEYFLNADGTVRWSDVYLVGYSYGSQTLAVVAKYVRIGRGIATSGPVDEGFPNATWIKATSATPLDRMIALIGSSNIDSKVTTTTSAGWLVPTVDVNAGATVADLKGGHVFILQGQGHSEMCAGDGGNWKALCQYAFGVAQ
jgi:hypothetical protein